MQSEQELNELAIEAVLAVMASASTDKIKPIDWWTRARTALETSASVAETWTEMAAKLADKLEIEAFTESSSHRLVFLANGIAEAPFSAFRAHCERNAVYVVAMAQVRRSIQREGVQL